MPRNFKTARLINHMKSTDAMKALGISQPTLSAWEGERKSPSIEKLEHMADVYGVSTDYLLGRMEEDTFPASLNTSPSSLPSSSSQGSSKFSPTPVPKENLLILHGKPVWCKEHGWMLVNAIEGCFLQVDGTKIAFSEIENGLEVYLTAPVFAEGAVPEAAPLKLSEIAGKEKIWVEPISKDEVLREELSGWFRVIERFVENEFGNRFYLDGYGVKWWGFDGVDVRNKGSL